MPSLHRLRAISTDLIEIRDSGVVSADRAVRQIVVFLQECEADPVVLSSLNVSGVASVGDFDYDVSAYESLREKGINAFRAKILDLTRVGLEYRIIYVHFPNRDAYVVLAVLPRSIAYDHSHPKTHRIIRSYKELVDAGWS